MNATLKGHIALFVSQVIYALNYPLAKDLMPDYIGPFAIVFTRILGAGILFWITSLFVNIHPVEKKDLKRMALLALFGVGINQVLFIWGLSLTSSINSAIIMISNPIMVMIFTLIILKERITGTKVAGLSLAVLGALVILSYRGNFELGSDTMAGDLMTFVNSISWAVFVVMMKPLITKYNTATAMRWVFLFGSIYISPIGIPAALGTNWAAFSAYAVFCLSFVVIGTTYIAYFLNIYGLKELSPNTVSAYIYLQPFLTTIFAVAVGNDTLTPTKLASGLLIIAGLYLVTKKNKTTDYA